MKLNAVPVLPSQSSRTINELTTLTVTNTATDPDLPTNTLSYTLLVSPTNATISSKGVINWTPAEAQGPGTNVFTTRVVDNGVPALSATNTFAVVVNEVNLPPTLPSQVSRTIATLTPLVVTNAATDPDVPTNSLSYTLLVAPTNAAISGSGLISWTPMATQDHTTNTFITRVTDNGIPALSATNSFAVIVSSEPVVTLDSISLVAEGFSPTNNAIDPGETVTVMVALKNSGTGDSTNLMVTLLETNGITAPSGSQTYGVLIANGGAVSQPFNFTALGSCGGTLAPILRLQDGNANLGTLTTTLGLGLSGVVLTQNFDTVIVPTLPASWNSVATGAESPWVTRSGTNDSAPNTAYVPDPPNTGTSYLETPAIVLPLGQSELTFRNNYRLEADNNGYYDGGVLEIKVGAGSYTDILAAGGSFVAGGYNGTISTAWNSPLSGRQAWSSNSVGFITTAVHLPATAAGQTIQLRWLCASDRDNGNALTNGWYIDSISIRGAVCASNTPPSLPAQDNRTIAELTKLSVTNTASDVESTPEALTYSLAVAPTNAVISGSGVISWTPTQEQSPSTNTIITVVRDSASPPASATNRFTVVVREVNVAPTLPVVSDQIINELTLLTVTNTATNANIHSIIAAYVLADHPPGATIDSNGIITWTPSQVQNPTTNAITTVVTNFNPYDVVSPRLTATNRFSVIVNPTVVLAPPKIQSITLSNGIITISWNAVVGYNYVLERKGDLEGTNWMEVAPTEPALTSTGTAHDTVGDSAQRFYRVVVRP